MSNNSFPARPSVLIVDDEPGIRKLLMITLDESGYSPDAAENGAEAIRKGTNVTTT